MAKKVLGAAVLALVPLFAACSTQPPMAVPSPAPSVQASEAGTPTPLPTEALAPSETPTPSMVATPSPTSTVDPEAAKKKAAEAEAKRKAAEQAKAAAEKKAQEEAAAKKKAAEQASAANAAKSAADAENKADTQAAVEGKDAAKTGPITISDECAASTVSYRNTGKCANEAMAALKAAGYYSGKIDGTYGSGAANWTVHYQRSHGLKMTGSMTAETWAALKQGKPAIGAFLAGSCKGSGVSVCVHLASQTLYFVKGGQVQKTIKVRTAGWNQDKEGRWRMHGTGKGTFTVYDKAVNPSSPRYGEGAMPYSTMFDPNMYFHYSAGFAKVGYSGSSHGCVNIASKADAKWIMDNTPIGAKVVIY